MASTDTPSAQALRQTILDLGLSTPQEVDACLKSLDESGTSINDQTLGQFLVTSGVLTAQQLDRIKQAMGRTGASPTISGYEILERLGSGAMAVVYKARQASLDRIVAIKVLHERFANDQRFIAKLYAEGRAAAKLNHPNIVQAYDVGQTGNSHYFVMEHAEGKTLYQTLQEQGKLSESQAVKIMLQMAQALEHAHQIGLVHCDIKPQNIILTAQGVAKLADLGLARGTFDSNRRAQGSRPYGTPHYISPEQVRGLAKIDGRSDIYSLGVTFYHAVTGKVPFTGATVPEVMRQHMLSPLTPPEMVNKSVSLSVSAIIEKMMAKDPTKRYADCGQLAQDLVAVQQGQPPLHASIRPSIESIADLETGSEQATTPVALPKLAKPFYETITFWLLAASLLLNLILIVVLSRKG